MHRVTVSIAPVQTTTQETPSTSYEIPNCTSTSCPSTYSISVAKSTHIFKPILMSRFDVLGTTEFLCDL